MAPSRKNTKKSRQQKRRRTSRGGVQNSTTALKYIKVSFFNRPNNARTNNYIISDIECITPFAGKEVGKIMSSSFDLNGISLRGKITLENNKNALFSNSIEAGNLNDVVEFKLIPGKRWGYFIQLNKITPGSSRESIFEKIKDKGKRISWKDPYSTTVSSSDSIIVHGKYKAEMSDAFNGYRRNIYNVKGCDPKTAVVASKGGGGGTWGNIGSGVSSSASQVGAGFNTKIVNPITQNTGKLGEV
jgi:hypothetical protein